MTTVATDGVSIYADKRISGHVGDNTTIRDSGCKILNVQGKLCIGEHKLSFLGFAGALPNRTKITTVVNRFKGGITDFITMVDPWVLVDAFRVPRAFYALPQRLD